MQKIKTELNYDLIMENFDKIDKKISMSMEKAGKYLLRLSMGIVFIWFGILKPLGLSPAESIANQLVAIGAWWIPGNEFFYVGLAIIEVLIGIFFLFNKTLRIAIFLLFVHMPLTILPLILLPELTWQTFLLVPTLEGQYIIKNVVLISAAIVIGGTIRSNPTKSKN
ncbi:MAG: hypothetical protein ACW99A_12390 [Candidatus Kariarchaeaceae archaeon]|jgi:uncharacterized membrane protein YkgB